uniref:MHC class I antigen n=1 Tax=Ctenopharyngodon idella TaxID=7959 RepID=A0A141BTM5_CTEID|nr:MHC class I antigen [Ctenopharyngodon idella]
MRSVVLLLLGAHLAYAGTHPLRYFYTAVSGDIDFPEFTAVGLVDDGQFMYFDSNIMKAVPKTEWIRQNVGADYWDIQNQNLIGAHQVFKNNIQIAKERFNQSKGVHTVQRMYGCEWDDETEETNGFDQEGYDGEDFVLLDLKEQRYISPVPQGLPTVQKWNNNRAIFENDKQYLSTLCVEWLKKYLQYGKNSLEKTVSPQVSLLQKDPSSPVTCHATGFYPSGVTISWMKNGQDHDEDVDLGELIPNEDGTFQKMSTLKVKPDEWKNNKYSCVVEHQGKTISSILTEKEIRTNNEASVPLGIIIAVVGAVVALLVVVGVVGYKLYQKKGKSGFVPANTSDGGSNSSART